MHRYLDNLHWMLEGKEENEAVKQAKIADAVKKRMDKATRSGRASGQTDIGDLFSEEDHASVDEILREDSIYLDGTAGLARDAADILRDMVRDGHRPCLADDRVCPA